MTTIAIIDVENAPLQPTEIVLSMVGPFPPLKTAGKPNSKNTPRIPWLQDDAKAPELLEQVQVLFVYR